MKNDFGVGEVIEVKGWACHDTDGSGRVRVGVGMTVGTPARNPATVLGGLSVVWHGLDLPFVGFAVEHFLSFRFGVPHRLRSQVFMDLRFPS